MKINKIETCAQRLTRAIKENGLTQAELCRITGIPKSAMSQYIKGSFEPKQDRIYLLAKALNVSESWLMGWDESSAFSSLGVTVDTPQFTAPLYENVSAGFGAYADEHIVEYVPIYASCEREARETICIRVSGNSMYPKIEDGDIIQVHKQTSVDSGDIAVVLLDKEEGLVKRVRYDADTIILESINPEYAPRIFKGEDVLRLQVVGKVTKIIKSV